MAMKNDLESRLIDYAVRILSVVEALPRNRIGNHIAGQLVRSGTSPAPNYAEARDAESRDDFIHKIKVVLKELRESRVWLLLIAKASLIKPTARMNPVIKETNELISIFVACVRTAKKRSGPTPQS